jgi:hypothetical protein
MPTCVAHSLVRGRVGRVVHVMLTFGLCIIVMYRYADWPERLKRWLSRGGGLQTCKACHRFVTTFRIMLTGTEHQK